MTHADLLVYHQRAMERKLVMKQKQHDVDIVQKCSFKPQTLDYDLSASKKSVEDQEENLIDNQLF